MAKFILNYEGFLNESIDQNNNSLIHLSYKGKIVHNNNSEKTKEKIKDCFKLKVISEDDRLTITQPFEGLFIIEVYLVNSKIDQVLDELVKNLNDNKSIFKYCISLVSKVGFKGKNLIYLHE